MRRITILSVCLIALLGLIAVAGHSTKTREKEVIQIGLDYKTYSSLKTLRSDADVIVRGKVLGSRVISEQQLSAAQNNKPQPSSLPRTHAKISVTKVIKGALDQPIITVSQIGGEVNDLVYQVEDLSLLAQDQEVLLFLKSGSRGIYYPLSGGTAVALKAETDTYILPDTVNNAHPVRLSNNAQELQNENQ